MGLVTAARRRGLVPRGWLTPLERLRSLERRVAALDSPVDGRVEMLDWHRATLASRLDSVEARLLEAGVGDPAFGLMGGVVVRITSAERLASRVALNGLSAEDEERVMQMVDTPNVEGKAFLVSESVARRLEHAVAAVRA